MRPGKGSQPHSDRNSDFVGMGLGLIMLFVMLAACVGQNQILLKPNANEPVTVSPTITGPYLSPEEPPTEGSELPNTLGSPPSGEPTEEPVPNQPPALYYIQGNQLIKLIAGEATKTLGELPEAGPVKNAIQVGNTLLVLREGGIQRVDLADGATELLFKPDLPVLFGDFLLADQDQILYSAVIDDPSVIFGFRTLIGTYRVKEGILNPSLSLPQNLRVLGLTLDGRGLYLLPVGQDPEFDSVRLFDLISGEMEKELPVEGSGYASLAPNGRLLATASQIGALDQKYEGMINLYDLPSLPLTPPRSLALPQSPSHVTGLIWSPNGGSLYFLLNPGSPWDEPSESYGLWRLEVPSGEFSQVIPLQQTGFHLRGLSPDGQWLLLEHESKPGALLVNQLTGDILAFTRPNGAQAALWH
jgi:hypothetical protein